MSPVLREAAERIEDPYSVTVHLLTALTCYISIIFQHTFSLAALTGASQVYSVQADIALSFLLPYLVSIIGLISGSKYLGKPCVQHFLQHKTNQASGNMTNHDIFERYSFFPAHHIFKTAVLMKIITSSFCHPG